MVGQLFILKKLIQKGIGSVVWNPSDIWFKSDKFDKLSKKLSFETDMDDFSERILVVSFL